MHYPGFKCDNPSQWSRIDSTSDPELSRRNRYLNVEPFASNRVRLRVPEGVSDYINASPIMLKQTVSGIEKRYIATQGPKRETVAHMWRMALTETGSPSNPAVVVMLTQTHESGKEKCAAYYPLDMQHSTVPLNKKDEFGDGLMATLTLKSIREDRDTRSTVREIELAATSPTAATVNAEVGRANSEATPAAPTEVQLLPSTVRKPIFHLLFTGWPDFSIPEGPDREALIHLIALSARANGHSTTVPRIVHCSAGVGRSGTFIALDYLLQEIAEGAWDDVSAFDSTTQQNGSGGSEMTTALDEGPGVGAETQTPAPVSGGTSARDSMILTAAGRVYDPVLEVVDCLRRQRMMMVQGEGQYAFLYDVCREVWLERHARLKYNKQQ